MTIEKATPETLNSQVEFDCPFMVLPHGNIDTSPERGCAPSVYLYVDKQGNGVGTEEVECDREYPWEPVTGYSGQHGYSGPVMHASEYLGGNMASDVLGDWGGVYVVCAVECLPDWEIDENAPDDVFAGQVVQDNPAGWMLLKLKGTGL